MSGLRRAIFRALDRLAAACANRILANSKSVLELAVQEGVVDCGVVLGAGSGNGIDLARFRGLNDTTRARANLGLSADGKVIGFVGRITKDKGVSDLLRAFDAVLEEQPDTNLLLVGPFESGDCLTERDERRIANDHRIVHRNEMSDPLEGFACIDVLAFPSYREGLPNVPLEAQACGIPVVAYASTGTVDAVQDRVGGRLIQVGNVDLLAGALVEILEDSEMRQALGSRGKNWVSCRFDQQALWQALGQCYWEWCGFRNPQEGVADCARLPG
jgi:glycosyltransferase involved in cell wall biosynthesis